jgi:plasmid stabilization system protein ParE
MRVHWTDRAKTRLRLIHDHIAKDAPLVASQVVERLLQRSVQIGDLPASGRTVPEYQRDDIREILERPYRIIYRILPDRIHVIAVMHYRQLLPGDLKE